MQGRLSGCLFIVYFGICFTLVSCSKISSSSVTNTGNAGAPPPTDQIQAMISANTKVESVYKMSKQDTDQLKTLSLVSEAEASVLNTYLTQ